MQESQGVTGVGWLREIAGGFGQNTGNNWRNGPKQKLCPAMTRPTDHGKGESSAGL